jgi:hypothetical protein
MMMDPNDPPPQNPINRMLDNPVAYGIGAVLVVVMVAQGMLEGWLGAILLGVAAYGTWRWVQKRRADRNRG